MNLSRKILFLSIAAVLAATVSFAQYRPNAGRRWFGGGNRGPIVRTEGGQYVNEETVRTARETMNQSEETPNWTNAPDFAKDVFTFTRILYTSPGRSAVMGWINDYPDSDLNLSYRLHELTSMNVDPDGRVIRLTDPALFDYPFIFAAQPGGMELTDQEIPILRRYLLNGGAFMLDDFWGTRDWLNVQSEMKRVFPDREWVELTIDHPLFHCVFDFKGPVNNLQTPSIHHWLRNYNPNAPEMRVSNYRGEGSEDMHVRAIFDDKGRIMVISMQNCDDGDGWEREAENETFFKLFSEPRAYPLAINILFYLMTH
jgi:hypothetical protein